NPNVIASTASATSTSISVKPAEAPARRQLLIAPHPPSQPIDRDRCRALAVAQPHRSRGGGPVREKTDLRGPDRGQNPRTLDIDPIDHLWNRMWHGIGRNPVG